MSEATDVQAAPDAGSIREIEALLEAELGRERDANRRTVRFGGAVLLIVALYLGWAFTQFARIFDPEELSSAITGLAVDAIPVATKSLRSMVVDGAGDIAQNAGESLIGMIPTYRLQLEAEISPIVDEAAETLAEAWIKKMIESTDSEVQKKFADRAARAVAAEALVKRVGLVLDGAMNEPSLEDGRTPRQAIAGSLAKLAKIDEGLKRIAQKKGDPKERELLISWLNLVDRYAGGAIGSDKEGADKHGKGPAKAARTRK